MNPIVIIGGSHHNTLGVIRAYGRRGMSSLIYLVLIGDKRSYVLKSRYLIKKQVLVVRDLDELGYAMHDLCQKFPEKAVVVCCSDSSIAYMDSHRGEFAGILIIPNAGNTAGRILELMDKNVQAEHAIKHGLSVPENIVYNVSDGAIGQSAVLNFPVIVKPSDSIIAGKSDIRVCGGQDELERFLNESNCSRFIIQKYIEKDFEFQLIGCSIDGGSEIVIPGYTVILRQPQNTNTGFLYYSPLDELINDYTIAKVRGMIRDIGYSGLFSAEFLRSDDGTDYFLEINFRNDGNSICVTDSGVNLPLVWYLSSTGQDISEEISRKVMPLYCMPEIDDFVMVLKGKVGIFDWLKDCRRTTSFMEYASDDRIPFFVKMRQFIGFLCKKTFGKK